MYLSAAPLFLLAFVAAPDIAQVVLSGVDKAAAFSAAGFKRVGGEWRSCDAPPGSVYQPGKI